MMGNFLTTLGSAPEEDRAMFEDLGLNVTPQPDNGTNPRPDNRSGRLEGETPDLVADVLESASPAAGAEVQVRVWDPSTQLCYRPKRAVPPRPDGAPNRAPAGWGD
jgi:biotin synthase